MTNAWQKKRPSPSEVVPGDCLSIATGSQVLGGCTVHSFLLLTQEVLEICGPNTGDFDSPKKSMIYGNLAFGWGTGGIVGPNLVFVGDDE